MLSGITKRETQVLQLGSEGLTDAQIAERLGVSVTTVRTYWQRIRDKTGGLNRRHAILRYLGVDSANGSAGAPPDWLEAVSTLLPYVLIIADTHGQIKYFHGGNTGSVRGSLVGQDLYGLVEPSQVDALRRSIAHIKGHGATTKHRLRLRLPDGEPRWIKSIVGPVRRGDNVVGVAFISVPE
ncbi:MAG: LuxR C-terminal-related transcriptional regulator [Fimbriimonadaceae bacterium]